MNYYNEFDRFPAQWLRNLSDAGHISKGYVDERSITDVKPEDVRGYTQCHFFAGIGVWSHALRIAGWGDDREVWTGSCPCQPFSAAGRRGGTADARHLWPEWFRLIKECRPRTIFGEQVASKDGLAWLDIVYADLESAGYTVGALDLCASGLGAPHIRQRLFFVAELVYPEGGRFEALRQGDTTTPSTTRIVAESSCRRRIPGGGNPQGGNGTRDWGAESISLQCEGREGLQGGREEFRFNTRHDSTTRIVAHTEDGNDRTGEPWGRGVGLEDDSTTRIVANARNGAEGSAHREGDNSRRPDGEQDYGNCIRDDLGDGVSPRIVDISNDTGLQGDELGEALREVREPARNTVGEPGPVNGFWKDAVWLPCRDGKARATQPRIFPLVDGTTGRVGRLRAYGNAIAAPVAAEFIKAYMGG